MSNNKTPDTTTDSQRKKSIGSRFITLANYAALIAALFSTTVGYSQTAYYSSQHQKKNTLDMVDANDNQQHQKIIKKNVKDILAEYGQEKGMEIIRKHLLEEINKKRNQLGNTSLKLNLVLNDVAQSKAQDMADNEYFDHVDGEGNSDAGRMIQDGRYDFQIFGSNISYNIKTIEEIIQSYIANNKRKTGHYNVIAIQEYEDLGVGLAKGENGIVYFVVNYGKQVHKK